MGASKKTTAANKKRMLAALEKHLGIVTKAAREVGIDRVTHYTWVKTDPEYAAAVEDIDDVAIDFAESCLFQQMREGVPTSTVFYLKYRARKRGYVDRKEISGPNGSPLISTIDPSKLSTDAIREILNAHENGDDD